MPDCTDYNNYVKNVFTIQELNTTLDAYGQDRNVSKLNPDTVHKVKTLFLNRSVSFTSQHRTEAGCIIGRPFIWLCRTLYYFFVTETAIKVTLAYLKDVKAGCATTQRTIATDILNEFKTEKSSQWISTETINSLISEVQKTQDAEYDNVSKEVLRPKVLKKVKEELKSKISTESLPLALFKQVFGIDFEDNTPIDPKHWSRFQSIALKLSKTYQELSKFYVTRGLSESEASRTAVNVLDKIVNEMKPTDTVTDVEKAIEKIYTKEAFQVYSNQLTLNVPGYFDQEAEDVSKFVFEAFKAEIFEKYKITHFDSPNIEAAVADFNKRFDLSEVKREHHAKFCEKINDVIEESHINLLIKIHEPLRTSISNNSIREYRKIFETLKNTCPDDRVAIGQIVHQLYNSILIAVVVANNAEIAMIQKAEESKKTKSNHIDEIEENYKKLIQKVTFCLFNIVKKITSEKNAQEEAFTTIVNGLEYPENWNLETELKKLKAYLLTQKVLGSSNNSVSSQFAIIEKQLINFSRRLIPKTNDDIPELKDNDLVDAAVCIAIQFLPPKSITSQTLKFPILNRLLESYAAVFKSKCQHLIEDLNAEEMLAKAESQVQETSALSSEYLTSLIREYEQKSKPSDIQNISGDVATKPIEIAKYTPQVQEFIASSTAKKAKKGAPPYDHTQQTALNIAAGNNVAMFEKDELNSIFDILMEFFPIGERDSRKIFENLYEEYVSFEAAQSPLPIQEGDLESAHNNVIVELNPLEVDWKISDFISALPYYVDLYHQKELPAFFRLLGSKNIYQSVIGQVCWMFMNPRNDISVDGSDALADFNDLLGNKDRLRVLKFYKGVFKKTAEVFDSVIFKTIKSILLSPATETVISGLNIARKLIGKPPLNTNPIIAVIQLLPEGEKEADKFPKELQIILTSFLKNHPLDKVFAFLETFGKFSNDFDQAFEIIEIEKIENVYDDYTKDNYQYKTYEYKTKKNQEKVRILIESYQKMVKELNQLAQSVIADAMKNPFERRLVIALRETLKNFTFDEDCPDYFHQVFKKLLIPFIDKVFEFQGKFISKKFVSQPITFVNTF